MSVAMLGKVDLIRWQSASFSSRSNTWYQCACTVEMIVKNSDRTLNIASMINSESSLKEGSLERLEHTFRLDAQVVQGLFCYQHYNHSLAVIMKEAK